VGNQRKGRVEENMVGVLKDMKSHCKLTCDKQGKCDEILDLIFNEKRLLSKQMGEDVKKEKVMIDDKYSNMLVIPDNK